MMWPGPDSVPPQPGRLGIANAPCENPVLFLPDPDTLLAQLWMLFDQKIQFDRAMNDGKCHVADALVPGITALSSTEGVYR